MRRWLSERGAAAIEFALVVPLLLTLVFGIIDFGLIFNQKQAVTHGARAGVRAAAVANWGSDTSCSTATDSSEDATDELICYVNKRTDLDNNDVLVAIRLGGDFEVGNTVTVCVQYPVESLTGFFDGVVSGWVRSEAQLIVEDVGGAVLDNASEGIGQSGVDWSWCS